MGGGGKGGCPIEIIKYEDGSWVFKSAGEVVGSYKTCDAMAAAFGFAADEYKRRIERVACTADGVLAYPGMEVFGLHTHGTIRKICDGGEYGPTVEWEDADGPQGWVALKDCYSTAHARDRRKPTERNDMNAEAELPKYKCHKEVYALKIKSIEFNEVDGSAMITPDEQPFAPFRVDPVYVQKHQPKAGGYFIRYQDGYASWSPADVFEDGYTRI